MAWQAPSMVTTRHAVLADENAVLALWRRAGGPTRLAPSATSLRRLVERDPEALLIAEVDGRLAGTLVVGWDGWRCHPYRLAVEPDLRRCGRPRRRPARRHGPQRQRHRRAILRRQP
jgi:ribosomal protein S18 acetylase RimI-like enzyme